MNDLHDIQEWWSGPDLIRAELRFFSVSVETANQRLKPLRTKRSASGKRLAQRRAGRGGGWEYHLSILPVELKDEIVNRAILKARKAAPVEPKLPPRTRDEFDRLKPNARAKAHYRMRVLMEVEAYIDAKNSVDYSVARVAETIKEGSSTIFAWRKMVEGLPRIEWLPNLAPSHKGKAGKIAACTPEAWEAIKTDYLRLEKPAFAACYRRLTTLAEVHCWEIPSQRALWDRLHREIKHSTFVLLREGAEEAAKLYPAQQRDRSVYTAMEALNADGHMFDTWVKWKDGTVIRPLMLMVQDLYSNKLLGWHVGKSESTTAVRLAFYKTFKDHGIPKEITLDNGMAFASKIMTGGQETRNRGKIQEGEQDGILTSLGIKVNWTKPYSGQSKPIERAFRDISDDVAKDPRFLGAYVGKSPVNKPAYTHDPRDKAVPYELFMSVLEEGIQEYNNRKARRTDVCAGKLSFNQAFMQSVQEHPVTKATTEQLRVAMLVAEQKTARKPDGALWHLKNRYWADFLNEHIDEKVVIRFDPDSLHSGVHVYNEDHIYLGHASVQDKVGFNSISDARISGNAKKAQLKRDKETAEYQRSMTATQYAELFPEATEIEPEPEAKTVRMFHPKTQGSAAVAVDPDAMPDDEVDKLLSKAMRLKVIQNDNDF